MEIASYELYEPYDVPDHAPYKLSAAVDAKISEMLSGRPPPLLVEALTDERVKRNLSKVSEIQAMQALTEFERAVVTQSHTIRSSGAYLMGVLKRIANISYRQTSSDRPFRDLPPRVEHMLEDVMRDGLLAPRDLETRVVDAMKELPEAHVLFCLNEFRSMGRNKVKNISGFLMSLLRKYNGGPAATPSRPSPPRGHRYLPGPGRDYPPSSDMHGTRDRERDYPPAPIRDGDRDRDYLPAMMRDGDREYIPHMRESDRTREYLIPTLRDHDRDRDYMPHMRDAERDRDYLAPVRDAEYLPPGMRDRDFMPGRDRDMGMTGRDFIPSNTTPRDRDYERDFRDPRDITRDITREPLPHSIQAARDPRDASRQPRDPREPRRNSRDPRDGRANSFQEDGSPKVTPRPAPRRTMSGTPRDHAGNNTSAVGGRGFPPPPPMDYRTYPARLRYGPNDDEYVPSSQVPTTARSTGAVSRPPRAFAGHGLSIAVEEALDAVVQMAQCKPEDLEPRVLSALREMPEREGVNVVKEFMLADPSSIRNVSGYMLGIIRRVHREREAATQAPVRASPDYDNATQLYNMREALPPFREGRPADPRERRDGRTVQVTDLDGPYGNDVKRPRLHPYERKYFGTQHSGPHDDASAFAVIDAEFEKYASMGRVLSNDISVSLKEYLASIPLATAIQAIADLCTKDLTRIKNMVAYTKGIVRKIHERQSEPDIAGNAVKY